MIREEVIEMDETMQKLLEEFRILKQNTEENSSKIEKIIDRITTLEKSDAKREEQMANVGKAIESLNLSLKEYQLSIKSLEGEIKEQNQRLIFEMIQKQDSLIKLFVSKDTEEMKEVSKERKDNRKIELQKEQIQAKQNDKIWDIILKVVVGLLSVITLYSQFIVKN